MLIVVAVASLWILFFATHVGLATAPVRGPLVDRLGEKGFTVFFSGVAAVCFVALVAGYASVRGEGPPGLALGRFEVARVVLYGAIGLGFALAGAGLWRYPSSNYAMGRDGIREARGMNRITRHPFFVGLALLAIAHVFLAPRLVGAVFMAGFAVVSLIGARHQDQKLVAAKGDEYARFMRGTSIVPFGAIVAGRQRLVASELPWITIGITLLLCAAVRFAHAGLFAWYGAPVIAATLGGAGFFLAKSLLTGRAVAGPREVLPLLFVFVAVGHALVGLLVYADPLADIARDGVLNSVRVEWSDGRPVVPYDREAAFWFLFMSPLMVLLGRVVRHGIDQRDAELLAVVGRYSIGIAAIGIAVMPVSGFWTVLVLGFLVRHRAAGFVDSSGPVTLGGRLREAS